MSSEPSFFVWYYGALWRGFVNIGKTFLRFIPHYFNSRELFLTLLSPWKRDVSYASWQGLHPVFWVKKILNNFISRFLGMWARLCVLVVAFGVWIVVACLCILLGLLWIVSPAVFLGSVLAWLWWGGSGWLLVVFGLLVFYASTLFIYWREKRTLANQQQAPFSRNSIWPARVLARLHASTDLKPENLDNSELLATILREKGISQEAFERIVQYERVRAQLWQRGKRWWLWENLFRIQPLGRYWKYAHTPHLEPYTLDLTRTDRSEYAHLELIGRERAFAMTKLVLTQERQTNVLLIGVAGVGKTMIIHELARLIRERTIEPAFLKKRVLVFDVREAVNEALERGNNPELILRRLSIEAAYAGNIILVLDHIATVLTMETAGIDWAAALGEFFNLPGLQVIATASPEERERLTRTQPAFMKLFEVVEVTEPSESETLLIILQYFGRLEEQRVVFTWKALESIVSSSAQYDWDVPFPERALDLARETLLYWQEHGPEEVITPETVQAFLTLKTGMTMGAVTEVEQDKLLHLEEYLHRQIIGQEEAIREVAEALRRTRVGMGNREKPVGSFLFLGPTGVGKTETAKALARVYFGNAASMIRLDMSEYQTPDSLSRLIGIRALNQSGILSSQVREHPFGVLLLDEIEKASKEVLDLFLQVIDEGFLTDAFGRRVNFRHILIIATSNAGALHIKRQTEDKVNGKQLRESLVEHITQEGIFRLEFLGRFDGVIVFRPLTLEEVAQVARLKLEVIAKRVEKEKNIRLVFTPEVVEKIVTAGYNPVFGARSLDRFLMNTVESVLVKKIIAGELQNNQTVTLTTADFTD